MIIIAIVEATRVDELKRDFGKDPDFDQLCKALGEGGLDSHSDDVLGEEWFENLADALASCGQSLSKERVFDRIWKLVMYLRYYQGGGDVHWIKNPVASAKACKKLNWFQSLGTNCIKVVQRFRFIWVHNGSYGFMGFQHVSTMFTIFHNCYILLSIVQICSNGANQLQDCLDFFICFIFF